MAQPNILFIQSDQHRFDCLAVNGHPFLKTPALDRLAHEGMNFTMAFTPIPVCVPARNSLMYGQWSTEHLAIANWDTEAPRPARPGPVAFTSLLRDAGYALGHVGKWQIHPTHDPLHPDYGFHHDVNVRTYPQWRASQGLPPKPRGDSWAGSCDTGIAPEASCLGWSARHIAALMEAAAARRQPFFIQWDPTEPHLPNLVPEPYCSMYPPADIPPWPSYPDPLIGKPYIQAQQRRTWELTDWTWDDWSKIVGRYLGEISLLDAQIGLLLDTLERLKIAENTLVVYSTDHGDMCGAHGMIDKHYVMYDDVVRVPLIARWPGCIPAGHSCDAFVSHGLDLAATFCDVAGIPIPATFSGQTLSPLFQGQTTNGRGDIFSTYHGNQFGLYSQRMVRDRRWKYVWNATAEDEFYDLHEDPAELHNLATKAACHDQLAHMRSRMVAWMEQAHDPLLNHWTRAQLLEGLSV